MFSRSISPSFSGTSVASGCRIPRPSQVAQSEQDEVEDEDDVEVGMVLGLSSLLTVCGSPFESIVSGGKPGAGGTIPRDNASC